MKKNIATERAEIIAELILGWGYRRDELQPLTLIRLRLLHLKATEPTLFASVAS
jgi:hypothetical protein